MHDIAKWEDVKVEQADGNWIVSVREGARIAWHLLRSKAEAEDFAAVQRARLRLQRGKPLDPP